MPICEMAELNESGDTKVVWDSENPDEVAAARATTDEANTLVAFVRGGWARKCRACARERYHTRYAKKVRRTETPQC